MMETLIYRDAAELPGPLEAVSAVLPMFLEAGNPYFNWLFGGRERAMCFLDGWMRRSSSEVSILRACILMHEPDLAGVFLALNGAELRQARKADAVALVKSLASGERHDFLVRLEAAKDLFAPVADDEYYLSKLNILPAFRGRGWGRALVERYIARGQARGYHRFRLDVHVENEQAIRCYAFSGFRICGSKISAGGDIPAYYSMELVL